MFVEPTPKVIEALKTAIRTIGLERFLLETNASKNEVEKWLAGEKWIPLNIVSIACRINRSHGKPFNTLSNVIQGSVTVVRERTPNKKVYKNEEKHEIKAMIREEREAEEIIRKRKEMFNILMVKSILLLVLMIPFILLGYFIGGMYNKMYANIGIVLGIVIWVFVITVYTLITPIKRD